jgi:hypothetical protein
MTGSGIFNMGAAPIGIYGQQPWQEEARRRVYSESFGRGLSMQGTSLNNASRMQQLLAQNYASSFLPSGATLGGGTISSGFGQPSAGLNVPRSVGGRQPDWWRDEAYQFPIMR